MRLLSLRAVDRWSFGPRLAVEHPDGGTYFSVKYGDDPVFVLNALNRLAQHGLELSEKDLANIGAWLDTDA